MTPAPKSTNRYEPDGERWTHWLDKSPPREATSVEAWRYGWDEPAILNLQEVWPEMNIRNLWWRDAL